MANLLNFAKRLAVNAPVQLYSRMMQIAADKDAAYWKNELNGKCSPSYKLECEQAIQQAQTLVQKYTTLKNAQGKSVADFCVTSVCDLIATSMVMTAAGIDRIEKLKEKLRTASQDGAQVKGDVDGDHGHLYTRTVKGVRKTENDLADVFGKWCTLGGNGVIQIKFHLDGGDAHTFAIERAPSSNATETDPVFIVYQAYQNTYSLQDFLGLRSTTGHEHDLEYGPWAEKTAEQKKTAYGNDVDNFTGLCTRRLRMTRQVVGRGQELDKPDLDRYIVDPLQRMLINATTLENYVLMTASPANEPRTPRAEYMMVLVCDRVVPSTYQSNYDAVCAGPDKLTDYPTCALK